MSLAAISISVTFLLVGCGASTSSGPFPGNVAGAPPEPACSESDNFAVSLVSDKDGSKTPVEAATIFARTGAPWVVPRGGWKLAAGEPLHGEAEVISRDTHLHVTQGEDTTWQVDSGFRCR